MKRHLIPAVLCLALLAAACGTDAAKNSGNGSTGDSTTTSAASGTAASDKFGTLASPCGKDVDGKKVTVKAAEAGTGADKLYIGVANDRTSTIRPGVLQEMWDTSQAFVKWCNDQGGIGGLPIEVVDLDAQLLSVEKAMATACTKTFAMVGGGFVSDQLMFSGKDGSDFHKCKLINVPAIAVSPAATEGNGIIQPLPNGAYEKSNAWFKQLVRLYPEQMKKVSEVWGNLPSLKSNQEQNLAVAKTVDGVGTVADVSYDYAGPDWSLVAQQIKDVGATAVNFVGEPANLAALNQALKAQNFTGIVFTDANQADPILFSTAGNGAAEGIIVREAVHPFDEADKWPAVKQYLDIMKKDGPANGKIAALGIQSFSSWLLFATAAVDCAKSSGGELSRDCVMDAAFTINSWTAGGLHSESDPAGKHAPKCSMLVQAKSGEFTRLDPKIGDKNSDKDGFFCADLITLTGDFGKGNIDPARKH